MNEPVSDLVSVIIPVRNRASQMVEAVRSALDQEGVLVEVIVVDDGSTDGTAAVARSLQVGDERVRVIRRSQPGGPGAARESGRLLARGEYVKYLDSDDVLLTHGLSRQVQALRNDAEAGASYGFTRFRHSDGTIDPRPLKGTGIMREGIFPELLRWRWWSTANPLWRRSLLNRAGPWSELTREEDWEYDARVGSFRPKLAFVADWVVEVRDHPLKLTRQEPRHPHVYHDRAIAHALILKHAFTAGVDPCCPEMIHFARELFLLARQCAALGLSADARRLLDLSLIAAPDHRDVDVYRMISQRLGWKTVGELSALVDLLR